MQQTASSSTPPADKKERGFFRRHLGRFIASAILTVCVIWGARHSGLELVPSWKSFDHVRWWTVGVYVLFVAAMTYFRSSRWRFLVRKVAPHVPMKRLLAISLVGFGAILVLPFRLGEFVRPAMLREKGKVSFSAATGSVIGERVVDAVYLSAVLAIALLTVHTVDPLPEKVVGLPVTVVQVRAYAFLTLGIFIGVFTVLAVYFFARNFTRKLTLTVVGVVSRPLAERLAHEAERLADGLHFLRSGRDAAGFMFETTLYWGINALGMWFLAWGCGLHHGDGSAATFGEACAMMGMLGVTILIPGPPGMLGIFQAGVFCGMTMYYPTALVQERGAVYASLLFAVQVTWTIGIAVWALFSGHTSLKALADAEVHHDD